MTVIAKQRALLCDTLDNFETYQWLLPSLCEGWTARNVVGHLLVRERQPLKSIGLISPRFAQSHNKAVTTMSNRAPRQLLAMLRHGPPFWMRIIGDIQVVEDWIHWQDIVRGVITHDPNAHSLDIDSGTTYPEIAAVLTKRLPMYAKGVLRNVNAPLHIQLTNGKDTTWMWLTEANSKKVIEASPDSTHPDVTITGEIGELLLWITGRQQAAVVEVTGEAAAIRELTEANLTI